MKIILTGSTGFVGSATLQHCIDHPAITSIVVLTRRPLQVTHPKLTALIHKDFLTYPPSVISQLQGAEAVIWCLGTPTSGKEVHVDYTLAAAKAFITALAPGVKKETGKPFRFIYVSGIIVERDQDRSLWFLSEARKMRGTVETSLVDLEKGSEGFFQAISVRPSGIYAEGSLLSSVLVPLSPSWTNIEVAAFAAVMVEFALRGEAGHFVDNEELKVRGRKALEALAQGK